MNKEELLSWLDDYGKVISLCKEAAEFIRRQDKEIEKLKQELRQASYDSAEPLDFT